MQNFNSIFSCKSALDLIAVACYACNSAYDRVAVAAFFFFSLANRPFFYIAVAGFSCNSACKKAAVASLIRQQIGSIVYRCCRLCLQFGVKNCSCCNLFFQVFYFLLFANRLTCSSLLQGLLQFGVIGCSCCNNQSFYSKSAHFCVAVVGSASKSACIGVAVAFSISLQCKSALLYIAVVGFTYNSACRGVAVALLQPFTGPTKTKNPKKTVGNMPLPFRRHCQSQAWSHHKNSIKILTM